LAHVAIGYGADAQRTEPHVRRCVVSCRTGHQRSPMLTDNDCSIGRVGWCMTGQTVTHYRVGEKLGEGGSAVV